MVRRWGFLVFCFGLLLELALWSLRIRGDAASGPDGPSQRAIASVVAVTPSLISRRAQQIRQRGELIEVLDQIVMGEHEFHDIYGRFTRVIGQTGVAIPLSVGRAYEVIVTEASSDRLQISALSEWNGQTEDIAAIDQDFVLHTSFELPGARPEYLKTVALRTLKRVHATAPAEPAAPEGELVLSDDGEMTLFRGYFDYRSGPIAVGKRAPVLGLRVQPPQVGSLERAPAAIAPAVKATTPHARLEIERITADH